MSWATSPANPLSPTYQGGSGGAGASAPPVSSQTWGAGVKKPVVQKPSVSVAYVPPKIPGVKKEPVPVVVKPSGSKTWAERFAREALQHATSKEAWVQRYGKDVPEVARPVKQAEAKPMQKVLGVAGEKKIPAPITEETAGTLPQTVFGVTSPELEELYKKELATSAKEPDVVLPGAPVPPPSSWGESVARMQERLPDWVEAEYVPGKEGEKGTVLVTAFEPLTEEGEPALAADAVVEVTAVPTEEGFDIRWDAEWEEPGTPSESEQAVLAKAKKTSAKIAVLAEKPSWEKSEPVGTGLLPESELVKREKILQKQKEFGEWEEGVMSVPILKDVIGIAETEAERLELAKGEGGWLSPIGGAVAEAVQTVARTPKATAMSVGQIYLTGKDVAASIPEGTLKEELELDVGMLGFGTEKAAEGIGEMARERPLQLVGGFAGMTAIAVAAGGIASPLARVARPVTKGIGKAIGKTRAPKPSIHIFEAGAEVTTKPAWFFERQPTPWKTTTPPRVFEAETPIKATWSIAAPESKAIVPVTTELVRPAQIPVKISRIHDIVRPKVSARPGAKVEVETMHIGKIQIGGEEFEALIGQKGAGETFTYIPPEKPFIYSAEWGIKPKWTIEETPLKTGDLRTIAPKWKQELETRIPVEEFKVPPSLLEEGGAVGRFKTIGDIVLWEKQVPGKVTSSRFTQKVEVGKPFKVRRELQVGREPIPEGEYFPIKTKTKFPSGEVGKGDYLGKQLAEDIIGYEKGVPSEKFDLYEFIGVAKRGEEISVGRETMKIAEPYEPPPQEFITTRLPGSPKKMKPFEAPPGKGETPSTEVKLPFEVPSGKGETLLTEVKLGGVGRAEKGAVTQIKQAQKAAESELSTVAKEMYAESVGETFAEAAGEAVAGAEKTAWGRAGMSVLRQEHIFKPVEPSLLPRERQITGVVSLELPKEAVTPKLIEGQIPTEKIIDSFTTGEIQLGRLIQRTETGKAVVPKPQEALIPRTLEAVVELPPPLIVGEKFTLTPPSEPPPSKLPGIPSIPLLGSAKPEPPGKPKGLRLRGMPGLKTIGKKRTMLADILSVGRSEAAFQKATHPSLKKRPGLWKLEGRAVPTVEQLVGKKPKKKGRLFMGSLTEALKKKKKKRRLL